MSLVGGAIKSGLGAFFGGVSGGTDASAQAMGYSSANPAADFYGGMMNAHGNVFSGGNLSDYRNCVVTQPTFFNYGTYHAFAHGAGLMGEAGPEAIMPLTRMAGGDLGVQAVGGGGGVLSLSLTIVDQTKDGIEAENPQASQNGMSLAVIVDQIDGALASRARGNKSKLVQYLDSSRSLNNARSLY